MTRDGSPGRGVTLDWTSYPLTLRTPLRISRSTMDSRDAVAVRLSYAGRSGYGEVVTSTYFGLDIARIDAVLRNLADRVSGRQDPYALRADLPALAGELPGGSAPGVLAAVDAALLDLTGRLAGVPAYRLVGQVCWAPAPTAYTIGLVPPSQAAASARKLAADGFQILKLKAGASGVDDDVARVAAVRMAVPGMRLLLDPNGAWTPAQAVRVLDALAPFRLEAVEQPIPPGTPDDLAWVSARAGVPVIADEDAATVSDVHALAGAVAGVNVKLAKCGGVREALRVVAAATEHGMDVMLGCLVASSLGIAPAVHLTGLARWVDLDGHLLLADDPWTGIGGHDGVLRLAGAPGLGVRRAVRP